MDERIAILGCGPAGLLAAHAVEQKGGDVRIFSQARRSQISGAQYLHDPIPGLTDSEPDGMLSYIKIGDGPGYAKKVYGSPDAPVSWDRFETGERPAWSMQRMYELLWRKYHHYIYDRTLIPTDIEEILMGYDIVFCSLPAKHVCLAPEEHKFTYQRVAIADQSLTEISDSIIYNGREGDAWYRTSNIFGHGSTEWSVSGDNIAVPKGSGIVQGIKPLTTNCDCHENRSSFHRIGRFGRWDKSILVGDAYRTALEVLS